MNRRNLLHAAVAAPVAGFVHTQAFAPVEAQSQPQTAPVASPGASRFDALLREYEETRDALNAYPGEDDDAEVQPLLSWHYAVANESAATPAATLHDLAVKMLIADDFVVFASVPQGRALLADARRIVYGETRPQEDSA